MERQAEMTEAQLWELVEEACRRRAADPKRARIELGCIARAMGGEIADHESAARLWGEWRMDTPIEWRDVDPGEGWRPIRADEPIADGDQWLSAVFGWQPVEAADAGAVPDPRDWPPIRRRIGGAP